MDIITRLITIALIECYDRCTIDWHPDDSIPDSFQGECEIEQNFHPARDGFPPINDFIVFLLGVFCIIDAGDMECWHSSKLESEVEV